MSPGKLSLINDITKDNLNLKEHTSIFMSPFFGLRQHFSEANMTMFQSPKLYPFFIHTTGISKVKMVISAGHTINKNCFHQ